MSKPVSLFSGYSQKENRVTNYVLLVLRMLYEDSPSYLNEIFGQLFPEDVSNVIGVSFNQQTKKGASVPDGLITQKALSIFIEAKNHDWFYKSQIDKHLAGLNNEDPGIKVLMLLGNIEADVEERFEDISKTTREKYSGNIHFKVVTFESLIFELNELDLPKRLQDLVDELEHFFDEESLLPRWKNMLDVVNCSGSFNNVREHGIYTCPTSGGAYSHRRCKYFGAYGGSKLVEIVSEIRAVLEFEDGECTKLSWINTDESRESLIDEGIEKLKMLNQADDDVRVFLLGQRLPTKFVKDTKGGMQQSKLYFDITKLEATNTEHLATLLKSHKWSDLK